MDEISLALTIAIAIVLILLITCGKKDKSYDEVPMYRSTCSDSPRHYGLVYKPAPSRQEPLYRSNFTPKREGAVSSPSKNHNKPTKPNQSSKPKKMSYEDLDVVEYGSWNDMTQAIGLEPEIFESQAQYNKDFNGGSLGPAHIAERSDDNDVVTWVGLKRPNYQATHADETARVVHSQLPEQLPKSSYFLIG
jgi:hypothetical protein